MNEIRLIDESLNPQDTPFYHLSIQANLNGLSFSILDTKTLKYIVLKQIRFGTDIPEYKYPDHLAEAIQGDDLLKGDYKDVFCIWETDRTTLLPSALYNRDNLKTYFEFNRVLNDLDELHADCLDPFDAYLVYPVNHEIANAFIKAYPRIRFFNQATPFIRSCLKKNSDKGKMVYADFHLGFFDVAVCDSSNLLLHNSFAYKNEKDIIYYILHVYEKLKLDTKGTGMDISGKISEDPEVGTIKKYVKTVRLASPDDQYQYSETFKEVGAHYFVNLFNLYSCGS